MGGDGARRDVHDRRGELTGDLVHIGDHEQQPLGSRKRGGKRAPLEGSVHGAGGAPFTLHFRNDGDGSENVGLAVGGPLIGELGHGG